MRHHQLPILCILFLFAGCKGKQKEAEIKPDIPVVNTDTLRRSDPASEPAGPSEGSATGETAAGETEEAMPEVIECNIDGEFEGWDGDKIFKLTNGQIWQQDEYKYSYSYKYRPAVTIVKSGGSYKMMVDGMNDAVRVRLLKGGYSSEGRTAPSAPSVIEAYITSDFSGFSYGNIYQLNNGQVWEQTESYTYTYMYSQPRVMIYRSGGGYKLRFDRISHEVAVRQIR